MPYLLSLLGDKNGKLEIIQAQSIVVQMMGVSQEAHVFDSFVGLFGVLHYKFETVSLDFVF